MSDIATTIAQLTRERKAPTCVARSRSMYLTVHERPWLMQCRLCGRVLRRESQTVALKAAHGHLQFSHPNVYRMRRRHP